MTPIRSWKRFIVLGCSHGNLIDKHARRAVLDFIAAYKPHTRIHLGDFLDTTAFRSGAKGTPDESADIVGDESDGLGFLMDMRATSILCGNHEARLWKLAKHPNSIVAKCARDSILNIQRTALALRAPLLEYDGMHSMARLGNFKYCHGYIYSENACRDMAEAHGNVIFAHSHRAGMAWGRRDDDAVGINVGTLSDIPAMSYANARRATLAWSQGFVWGEYCDSFTQPFLFQKPKSAPGWILPKV